MSGPAASDWIRPAPDGVRLAIRLTPKAAADRIQDLVEGPDGPVLKAGVTAAPENGRANAALTRLLARAWKLPRTSLTIVSGQTDRRKTLHIAGDAAELTRKLEEWLAAR